MARRPHRSFRRTRYRDHARSMELPGYIAFTAYVGRTLLKYRRTFLWQVLVFTLMMIAVGAIANQTTYKEVSELLGKTGGEVIAGTWGKVGETGVLLIGAFSGWTSQLTIDQQIYLGFASVFVWLTTVWLLREMLTGRKPRFREGLYSAGAPLMPTLIIAFVLMLQMIPLGLMAMVYNALTGVGILQEGFGMMLFYLLAATVAALVLYWIVGTFIALIVITLPGVYPMQAFRAAGDLVVGRRLRIMFRMVWASIVVSIVWGVVMIPVMLIDGKLKSTWPQLDSVPIVPVAGALMVSLSVTWFAAYVYLLYRKIIEDDAKPA